MSNEKENIIVAVVDKFISIPDESKKMYVLGFMDGMQMERATRESTAPAQLAKKTA